MLDDEMKNYALKKFIDDNEVLINGGEWAQLYENAKNTLHIGPGDSKVGKFTELLLAVGTDPLADLDYIPEYYLEGASITTFVIPKHITFIDSHAFADCKKLTNITIPNGVRKIGWGAFYDCSRLTNVDIPDSVISIEGEVFYGCSSLKSVTIGKGVREIVWCAFYGCSRLTNVTIPEGVSLIGYKAFLGCKSLTKIIIPYSVQAIEPSAFGKKSSITICGPTFSYAQQFAYENGFPFQNI